MEKEITIKYNWKCNEDINIPEKHEEALEEDAMERIFEMMKEGYTSGELHTTVRYGKDIVSEEDEEEGLSYSGWWWKYIKSNK
jgi:uncharacterized protein YoaH (UPF0181 family)